MSVPYISVGLMLSLIGMMYEFPPLILIGIAIYALAVIYYSESKDKLNKRINELEKEIKELKIR